MVKLSSANYLGSKDVKTGDMLVFVDEGRWEASKKYFQEDGVTPIQSFVIGCTYKGQAKSVKITKASRISLCAKYSDETANWVGKKASITLVPTPNNQMSIWLQPLVDKPAGQTASADEIVWKE